MSGIPPVVVVHGGAGDVPEARRPVHAEGAKVAAEAALVHLMAHGDALAAALVAVELLESDPLFNAGTGACLTEERTLELDASVMEGENLGFGAVACLPPFRHPIRIADAVRRDGRHAFYAGEGARRFAIANGFVPADPEEMTTEAARAQLERVLAGRAGVEWAGSTVGAVACDGSGRVAAATSTGGITGKACGRVGDSPLPGGGTFADDRAGACSATGVGEDIMRYGLAFRACMLLQAGVPSAHAAQAALAGYRERVAGKGGLILVDRRGEVGVARNTETMSYAVARAGSGTEFGF